uniref:Uncharacterized protein n=1 Tax=Anguilla anguilla TaxID=7936 RepID=A0A0E9Q8V7_ANGAN
MSSKSSAKSFFTYTNNHKLVDEAFDFSVIWTAKFTYLLVSGMLMITTATAPIDACGRSRFFAYKICGSTKKKNEIFFLHWGIGSSVISGLIDWSNRIAVLL